MVSAVLVLGLIEQWPYHMPRRSGVALVQVPVLVGPSKLCVRQGGKTLDFKW